MPHEIVSRFKAVVPALEFWSLRLVDERSEFVKVRQNVLDPVDSRISLGAHITVVDAGGVGYGATGDLSISGLNEALRRARAWARASAGIGLQRPEDVPRPQQSGRYRTAVERPWEDLHLGDRVDRLQTLNHKLKMHDAIVDWWASLESRRTDVWLVTPDVEIEQRFRYILPDMAAVAHDGAETQKRSYGIDYPAQGGLEHLQRIGFDEAARRVAEEALELLGAPDCPGGTRDLLLTPSQMLLQIHESIGHLLELDRILGDERNYAGTSFVTPDMFGSYRYGSPLLNVTFDPTRSHQVAGYAFDDEGSAASREYLIRNGILLRGLGGVTSQRRAGLPGVAASRACDWNRPAIDRMANLNLEPGASSLAALISAVEDGVLMDTNRSWSIDDSRNKFQFGCEYGRLITDGELRGLVKNPNYRGISATFWRSLKGVGDESTFEVMGTATCGKGEANQAIQVGHAAPACLFENVVVFGSG